MMYSVFYVACWCLQVKGVAPAVTEPQAEALLAAAAAFRDAYLSATLSRLNEAVGAAFPGGSRPLPTAVDLQKCIGYVSGVPCTASNHTLQRTPPSADATNWWHAALSSGSGRLACGMQADARGTEGHHAERTTCSSGCCWRR